MHCIFSVLTDTLEDVFNIKLPTPRGKLLIQNNTPAVAAQPKLNGAPAVPARPKLNHPPAVAAQPKLNHPPAVATQPKLNHTPQLKVPPTTRDSQDPARIVIWQWEADDGQLVIYPQDLLHRVSLYYLIRSNDTDMPD